MGKKRGRSGCLNEKEDWKINKIEILEKNRDTPDLAWNWGV